MAVFRRGIVPRRGGLGRDAFLWKITMGLYRRCAVCASPFVRFFTIFRKEGMGIWKENYGSTGSTI